LPLAIGGTDSGTGTGKGPGLFFLQLSEQYLTSSKFFHFARSCMIRVQVTQYLKRFQTPDENTRRCSRSVEKTQVQFPHDVQNNESRCRLITSIQDAGGIIASGAHNSLIRRGRDAGWNDDVKAAAIVALLIKNAMI
jgi:hypothetical protein